MADLHGSSATGRTSRASQAPQSPRKRSRRGLKVLLWSTVCAAVLGVGVIWIAVKASVIEAELSAAMELVGPIKDEIAGDQPEQAIETVNQLRGHTTAAREAANDPIWTLASSLPGFGANFSAVAEVARSADDVASLGLSPLARVFSSLEWDHLLPNASGTDLEPLKAAAPSISSAAHAVRVSEERLNQIDTTNLIPKVAEPLIQARLQLGEVTGTLDAAANAAQIVPGMLGADTPRDYLLMIQNNAESRASGGIPGALAVLNIREGKLSLSNQSSASELGSTSPGVPVDMSQEHIYSTRLGKFMQDVNLTPDFPTAATTAQSMWERKKGQRVDGVISVDPVALSYILQATGPVKLKSPDLVSLASAGLPVELDGDNVVQTLLSDVYAKIEEPRLQDIYFAGVAQEIFTALSDGRGNASGLIEGITRGAEEGRVLVWSSLPAEQAEIAKYSLSGSISGRSVSPAEFGVYFNDGTGAKMDYYVKRTAQLVKECIKDGYREVTVRVTSTNTAPIDSRTSLPAYVTGDGAFGITPGSVQTNIVVYGPVQSMIETASVNGQRSGFASHLHNNRPVGVVAVHLAPSESQTVDFTFAKIVQHAEPKLVVTPTVQPVKDVTLRTETAPCD